MRRVLRTALALAICPLLFLLTSGTPAAQTDIRSVCTPLGIRAASTTAVPNSTLNVIVTVRSPSAELCSVALDYSGSSNIFLNLPGQFSVAGTNNQPAERTITLNVSPYPPAGATVRVKYETYLTDPISVSNMGGDW